MKRRLLSVILAVVLILSMAIPAFALTSTWTTLSWGDNYEGYAWNCVAKAKVDQATSTFSYNDFNKQITVQVYPLVYVAEEDSYLAGVTRNASNYGNVSVTTYNNVYYGNNIYQGTLYSATTTCYVVNTRVTTKHVQ